MAQPLPDIAAAYKIVAQAPGEFTIEVTIPGEAPTRIWVLRGNKTADQWIAEHRQKIAHGPVKRRFFDRVIHVPSPKSKPL
jgi:hypothetical protein